MCYTTGHLSGEWGTESGARPPDTRAALAARTTP